MSRNRPTWKILSGIHKKEFSDFEEDNTRIDSFMELIRNYTDCPELTTPMIHEFIDKIIVYEADKRAGERIQQIDIYLKYTGKPL